jgi:hypothetical protein
MKINGPINQGLVFDGLYFRFSGACCRYKSLGAWKRPQWRKDHPDDFVPLSEVEPSIASENETDVETSLKTRGPNPLATPANETMLSAPRPVAGFIQYRTTKTEVLNRAKAALESGESLRDIAERLADAKKEFHVSQREIGRTLGRSASWVNRLLKWGQSGYKQTSPFGPTTRAARAVGRNGPGGCGGPKDPDDDGQVSLVPQCCSPADQPASRRVAVNAVHLSGPTQTDLMPSTEAATTETQPTETETTPHDQPARKPGPSANRQLEKQVSPARKPNAAQKLSLERMRIVLDALKECPILGQAAAKAGIHPKTLTYWLRRSEAGHDGYDIEWDGVQWRFHEHCQSAIEQAHDILSERAYQVAMGVTHRFDDNGNMIEEVVGPPNPKMIRFLLAWGQPERWAQSRKSNIRRTGGVLVIGERAKDPTKGCASSVRARQWKSIATKIGKAKH